MIDIATTKGIDETVLALFEKKAGGKEKYKEWLSTDFTKELTFGPANVQTIIKYAKNNNISEGKLFEGIDLSNTDLNKDWHEFNFANNLIQNTHDCLINPTMYTWFDISKSSVPNGVGRLILRGSSYLTSLKKVLPTIQWGANRIAKHGIISLLEHNDGFFDMLIYLHPSLKDQSLGHTVDYYSGGISATAEFFQRSEMSHNILYRSVLAQNILTKLYHKHEFMLTETKKGINVDGIDIIEKGWLLEETVNDINVYTNEFIPDQDGPFYRVENDLIKDSITLLKKGTILNIPYSRVQFFYNINQTQELEDGPRILVVTPNEFQEFKNQIEDLEKHNIKSKKRNIELTELVEEKTIELRIETKKAKEANNAKSEFLRLIAHDLRNPVHTLLGYLSLSQQSTENPDLDLSKIQSYLSKAHDSGLRINRFVEAIWDLSKLDSGKWKYDFTNNCLYNIVNDIYKKFDYHRLEKNLSIELIKPDFSTEIEFDISSIESVVSNLVSNAIKYTPQNREINIYFKQHREGIELYVKDQGVGIPKSDLEKIFEAFYQSQHSEKREDSTGLGLHIVKNHVLNHHGTIKATCNPKPESGTTFCLYLPYIHIP
jgi:signal transduction histidine kinase